MPLYIYLDPFFIALAKIFYDSLIKMFVLTHTHTQNQFVSSVFSWSVGPTHFTGRIDVVFFAERSKPWNTDAWAIDANIFNSIVRSLFLRTRVNVWQVLVM